MMVDDDSPDTTIVKNSVEYGYKSKDPIALERIAKMYKEAAKLSQEQALSAIRLGRMNELVRAQILEAYTAGLESALGAFDSDNGVSRFSDGYDTQLQYSGIPTAIEAK